MARIGIQIISYNRPDYLKQTLKSVMEMKCEDDVVCVIEQSDDKNQDICLEICSYYDNIKVIPVFKNLGQRGATNLSFQSKFWDDCKYVMISDHDNIFHEPLTIYCDILDNDPNVFVASGYISPEHDIENKKGEWIYKSTARAGHMVLRKHDFYTLAPFDLKAGTASWFAGLDWAITHWSTNSPGKNRNEFIACYPGGVEHIGRESTWQGSYDDEIPIPEQIKMRTMSLQDLIKIYPPKHTYISDKYWYEKEPINNESLPMTITPEQDIDTTENNLISMIKAKYSNVKIDISKDKILINLYEDNPELVKLHQYLMKKYGINEVETRFVNTINSADNNHIIAFNYIWPGYNFSFLENSIKSIIDFVDMYIIVINKYSYIGNEAPPENIKYVNDICSKFGDKVVILDNISTNDDNEHVKSDNIAYYFKYFGDKNQNLCNYIWMVQSDEVYDSETLDKIKFGIRNHLFENRCNVFIPFCYIDSPHWVVTPNEDFRRPTFIDISLLKKYDFNIRDIPQEDIMIHENINFHHLSYVLTKSELNLKFDNWGHRNDLYGKESYLFLLDQNKTNKQITNLHPVIPPTYKSVKFKNDQINKDLFIDWCKFLIDHNRPYDIFSTFFDKLDPYFPDNCEDQYCMTITERKLYSAIITHFIPDKSNIVEYGCWNGYNMLLTKMCSPNCKYIGIDNYNSPDKLFSQYSSIGNTVYKLAVKKIFNSNLDNTSILTGDYKMLSILKNDSVDFFYLNSGIDAVTAKNCIIEIWPKMKSNGIILGHYALTDDIKALLPTIICNDTLVNCPWGQEMFNFDEIYYNLLDNIAEEQHYGMWLARVKK